MLFCAANADLRRALAPFRSFVSLYDDHWHALTAVRAYVPRWVRKHLAPVSGSPAVARRRNTAS